MAQRTGRAQGNRYSGVEATRRKRLCYAIIHLISKDLRLMTGANSGATPRAEAEVIRG
jgi:hypothetical protein